MSREEDTANAESQSQTDMAEETVHESDAPVVQQPVSTRPKTWPGVMGLLLALIAIGISGWLSYERYFQAGDSDEAGRDFILAEQSAAISALEQANAELERRLEAQSAAQASTAEQVNRLAQQSDSREAQLGALEQGLGRLDERTSTLIRDVEQAQESTVEQTAELADLRRRLEAAVEQMDAAGDLQREIDRDLRRQMLMLEAAGLLRVGQDLAEVQGRWGSAQQAFERARRRLAEVEDARLDPVRRTLAQEIEALSAFEAPDLNAQLARLQRLGQESRGWPLQLSGMGSSDQSEIQGTTDDAGKSWSDRLGQTFGALVKVERRDDLGRDEEQFEAAREQLQLRLLATELALLRRDESAVDQQVAAALALIDGWFDTEAEAVASGRESLEAIGQVALQPVAPDLGATLDQLQTRLTGP
jgi:uncharacterized protein HemX